MDIAEKCPAKSVYGPVYFFPGNLDNCQESVLTWTSLKRISFVTAFEQDICLEMEREGGVCWHLYSR